MKKNILVLICLMVFGFAYIAIAQEGVTDCGELKLNGDSLDDNDDVVFSDELICLGEKILTNNSSAKVSFKTDSYGEMEFYVERADDDNFVGKVSFGDAEGMSEEYQKYANTFYACPSSIDDITTQNPDIDFGKKPGALAFWAYSLVLANSSDPVTNNCVGTYFTVVDNEKKIEEKKETEDGEEKIKEGQEEVGTEDYEVEFNSLGIDKRKTFSEIMNTEKISEIEKNTDLTVSDNVDSCNEDDTKSENICKYYFNGTDKDQFNNPVVNLSVHLVKQNKKVNDVFSLYQSLIESANVYTSLVNNYKNIGYIDNSDKIELPDLNKDSYVLMESDDKRLIVLKDSWVIEVDFTSGVGNEYVASLAEEIVSEIDDLLDVSMPMLQSFDQSLQTEAQAKKDQITEEEIVDKGVIEEGASKAEDRSLSNRLKGRIILKVEDNGEAYYVDPRDGSVNFLGKPEGAFQVMREKGIGITTANLKVIPIGLIVLAGPDDDGDGLSNIFEDAMSTDKSKADMDGDSYSDKDEIEGGYSPYGVGELVYDYNFTKNQLGKIFLQVENNGEAWYVNPGDSKRYFLGRPEDAFNIMKTLGLGISNQDFASLGTVIK